ncbi:MAG: PilZ domain-containing protein [Planctomycetes bacterium]|nr:PilZ domain-containing protein [Planctomycetota bacterium]
MADSPKQKNRRAFLRRRAKGSVKVACRNGMDLGPNLAISLVDICEDGVRLITKPDLKKGQEVIISLEGTAHSRPLKISGMVAWTAARAEDAETMLVGIQFQKRLPYRELLEMA